MTHQDYEQLLESTFQKMWSLWQQQEGIESELLRLKQFAYATGNMLPDETRERIAEKYLELFVKMESRTESLTDAVRTALQSVYPKWQTTAKLKTLLLERGFDFGSYSSNPLSSISTALRRLKETDQIEAHDFDGVAAFRAKESAKDYLLRKGNEILGKKGSLDALYASGMRGEEKPRR